uniref:Uncharacterized protein n=1 Tax=viral metagenome TaxID=1070528 RepID=A0A6C0E4J4_9ZZZZ
MEEEPKVPSSNTKLLYFFINDYSLYNWYKNIFYENRIELPFTLDTDVRSTVNVWDPKIIIHPLLDRRLISDINISIDQGNLSSFNAIVYLTDSNKTPTNDDDADDLTTQWYGRLKPNVETFIRQKSKNDTALQKLSTNLNINENVTCNVTCRFFVIGKKSNHLKSYEELEIDFQEVTERYNNQFEIDKGKKKLVFIGEDFNSLDINRRILDSLMSLNDAETNNKIITLPKYNTNFISYVLNNYNLNNFDNYFIESNRIVDRYNDSDRENSSFVSPQWLRGGIRSMRKPTKKTKKTKKTRKPRKKSRKSRKHKKSRKH